MLRRIRTASLCAALAAAVLAGGAAQAHAAPAQAPASAVSAVSAVQKDASAAQIWQWAGRYESFVAAEAAYYVLYGIGAAVAHRIEEVYVHGVKVWELYIQ
ncbi:hypothetical protein [Streptomyces sudanensis]|uniref:hypothetical protein n=1 Tax=Streptomyces sudanensis TaxID=436397 RepID=UPI0020CE38A3|nr:hypothetical protein [Streptomyces sudanensis]MCP9956600.1 hypothetical protein [Streptomyces sudanensis]MCQ0002795.1 hypothetical protein [Streptomyces sudanensis]